MIGKQGHGDYLCGIYALANAILDDVYPEKRGGKARAAFRLLIQSVETLGFLDARHLLHGFDAFELIEVFNLTASNQKIAKLAVHVADFAGGDIQKVTSKVFDKIFLDGGKIVWWNPVSDHWVLVIKRDGSCIDSWPEISEDSINLKKGPAVVIIPRAVD